MNTKKLLMSQIKEGARFESPRGRVVTIKELTKKTVQYWMAEMQEFGIYTANIDMFIDYLVTCNYTLIQPTPTANDLISEAIKEIEKNADKHHKHDFQSGYDVCLEYCINILKSKLQNGNTPA